MLQSKIEHMLGHSHVTAVAKKAMTILLRQGGAQREATVKVAQGLFVFNQELVQLATAVCEHFLWS